MVDAEENQRRHNHTAESGNDRKQCLLHAGEFADLHFPADFQTYGEEEHRHQYVIDEALHCHAAREENAVSVRRLEEYGDIGFQYIAINIPGERQVREEHCDDDTGQQNHALRPRLLDEGAPSEIHIPDPFGPGINRNKHR